MLHDRTATPCPEGFAAGVCPDGMACIADTPCTDSSWLARLESGNNKAPVQEQTNAAQAPQGGQSVGNKQDIAMMMQSSPVLSNAISCNSDNDCRPYNQFCNTSLRQCVECDEYNNRGCRVSEICATVSLGVVSCLDRQTVEEMMSYSSPPQAEVQSKQAQQVVQQQSSTRYQNPPDNAYFCGANFSAITDTCLQRKPCPSGVSYKDCDGNEGCFLHPSCKVQYANAGAGVTTTAFGAFGDIEDIVDYQEAEGNEGLGEGRGPEGAFAGVKTVGFRTTGLMNSASLYAATSLWGSLLIASVMGYLC